MWTRSKPPSLIDPHLHIDIERGMDPYEQAEARPPAHEVVEWHLSYLAEAYLPSHAERLAEGLANEGWDEVAIDRNRPKLVSTMRSSAFGGGWSNLGILKPQVSFEWGGVRESQVPDGVASVSLNLWSVTGSLTVLVAGFQWTDDSAEVLNHIAWTDYQSAALPSQRGRLIYGPHALKGLEARRARRMRHARLSNWLTEKVPGAFHELGSDHPVLDVITTAQARPFCAEPPLNTYDYRDALGLERSFDVATSPSMPGWKLALDNPDLPTVLTLAARTADVFDAKLLRNYGEVSRSAMGSYLGRRADNVVCGWAATLLLPAMRQQLVAVRDRAPVKRESSAHFARRLSYDISVALRQGADGAAYSEDILNRPPEAGPARVLQAINFVVEDPVEPGRTVGESWSRWIAREAAMIRRIERDQRERLATEAQLTGLVVDIRTQVQMRLLTIAAVVFAVAAVGLAVLQLLAGRS